ncbi:MAG: hypothetical protein JXR58_07820 [Bacteroidales bacterium]|nr:hypothetical protein [Bacteroidales bacterium]
MRKTFLSFIAAVFLTFAANSQVTLTTAVDFTCNDIDGNEVHLFELLDNGKYVVLEFFTSW